MGDPQLADSKGALTWYVVGRLDSNCCVEKRRNLATICATEQAVYRHADSAPHWLACLSNIYGTGRKVCIIISTNIFDRFGWRMKKSEL